MSKFDLARKMIAEGRYDDARRLLRGINDPLARKWLERLDERYPAVVHNVFPYVLMALLAAFMAFSTVWYVGAIFINGEQTFGAQMQAYTADFEQDLASGRRTTSLDPVTQTEVINAVERFGVTYYTQMWTIYYLGMMFIAAGVIVFIYTRRERFMQFWHKITYS